MTTKGNGGGDDEFVFKIEKNVPMPEDKYAFLDNMKVKDSVWVPTKEARMALIAAMRWRKMKAHRREDGDGWRVWRKA